MVRYSCPVHNEKQKFGLAEDRIDREMIVDKLPPAGRDIVENHMGNVHQTL